MSTADCALLSRAIVTVRPFSAPAAVPLIGKPEVALLLVTTLLLAIVLIAIVGALGLNILVGYTGQISIGTGAFMSVGAYTAAILMDKLDCPYYLTLPAAAILSFIVGYLFGLPALRLEGQLRVPAVAANYVSTSERSRRRPLRQEC